MCRFVIKKTSVGIMDEPKPRPFDFAKSSKMRFLYRPNILKTHIALILLTWVMYACSITEPVTPEPTKLTQFNQEVITYFQEVALGFEFGNASQVTRKWSNNPMKIYVGGTPTLVLTNELAQIITEINALATDGFRAEIVTDSSASNFYVYFGSGEQYGTIFPSQQQYVTSNWGLFSVFWNGQNNITRGYMYVDIFRADVTAQRHLLREELTQSLGLARDSPKYNESIFQQNWTTTTTYAPIDKEIIRLLYHPQISSGLSASQVATTLKTILLAEQVTTFAQSFSNVEQFF